MIATSPAARRPPREAGPDIPSATVPVLALIVAGIAGVVVGGLTAAVTAPLHLAQGSWSAAYLVLVWGVAQVAIGAAQHLLATRPARTRAWVLFALWNVGNAAVLIGTLVTSPGIAIAGSALLLIALVGAFVAVRGARRRVWAGLYRAFVVVLFVSVFVGIALSLLRHG